MGSCLPGELWSRARRGQVVIGICESTRLSGCVTLGCDLVQSSFSKSEGPHLKGDLS